MLRLLTIILELISFVLKRGKPKEEKEKDKFNEALAENNYKHLSNDLSDSIDRVQSKIRHNSE